MLSFYEKEQMISVIAERRKGTLITVLNYAEYAEKMTDTPAHNYAHRAAHNEASDTKASEGAPAHSGAHNPAHHEQEYINNNKNITSENSGESSDKPSKNPPALRPGAAIQSGSKWGSDEDLRAAEWPFEKVQEIYPSAKKPNYTTWANDIRLMRTIDNRNHKEICQLFKWACHDSFWKGNVLCPDKLREKWDQLSIQRDKRPVISQPVNQQPEPHWNSPESWKEFI